MPGCPAFRAFVKSRDILYILSLTNWRRRNSAITSDFFHHFFHHNEQ